MTHLSRYRDFDSGCLTSTVQGERQWSATFVGVLGNDHWLFAVAIVPYAGAGTYDDPNVLDNQGSVRPGINWPVHVLLSTVPPTDPGATEYGTIPTGFAPTSQPPVGHASVTIDPDQKSGRITAVLIKARAVGETPVTVSGTFKCGTLDSMN